MTSVPALSVLILPEDSSDQSHSTLKALAKKAFCQVDEHTNTAEHRIRFEPIAERYERLVHGAYWKAEPKTSVSHKEFADLIGYIAGKIAEPNGFVLVHVDGDLPYSKRNDKSAKKKNHQRFRERIEPRVRTRLENAKKSKDEINCCMNRILYFVPYYSLEAWLYQNIPMAKSLCAQNHQSACHGTFAAWEADRASVDEIEQIKTTCCLRSRYNLELAEKQFPARLVYDLGKSFKDAVDLANSSVELKRALEKTYRHETH